MLLNITLMHSVLWSSGVSTSHSTARSRVRVGKKPLYCSTCTCGQISFAPPPHPRTHVIFLPPNFLLHLRLTHAPSLFFSLPGTAQLSASILLLLDCTLYHTFNLDLVVVVHGSCRERVLVVVPQVPQGTSTVWVKQTVSFGCWRPLAMPNQGPCRLNIP